MRLFIAIDFNELKDYFLELQKCLPENAKLSMAKSFHITLKFLGDVQPDNVEEIISRLNAVKFKRFDVCLNNIGIFPTENYIRVVWVGVSPEENVLELHKKVDDALKMPYRKEKDFNAHITLARVKHPKDKKQFLEELKNMNVEGKKINIKEFKLIRSALSQKGPVYDDLAIFGSHQ